MTTREKPPFRIFSGAKARLGRPSSYTTAMADEICEEVAMGGALYRLCQERKNWPAERTVYQWLEAHQDFAQKYARARERAADRRVAEIVEIADSATDAQLAKVQIDARKWQAAKFAPRRYGDRVQLAGDAEQPLIVQREQTPVELARSVAFCLELAKRNPPQIEGKAGGGESDNLV